MATRAQIHAAVDAKLADAWGVIQTRQEAYYAVNGRYWQGLRTHAAVPIDGAEATPDIGTRTPRDQGSPWPLAIRTASLPMALQVHCYDGPAGQGYQAIVTVQIAGRTWMRSAQVGPETWRQHGWVDATEAD